MRRAQRVVSAEGGLNIMHSIDPKPMYFVIATDASSVVGTNRIVRTTKSSWENVTIHRTALLCLLNTTLSHVKRRLRYREATTPCVLECTAVHLVVRMFYIGAVAILPLLERLCLRDNQLSGKTERFFGRKTNMCVRSERCPH